jgi:microcompartment protein CcmK/EutM
MKIAKVVGVAISTIKEPRLDDSRLLLVVNTDQAGEPVGSPYIAQDVVGAGPDELVIIVVGSSARVAAWDNNKPVDAVIVGILDSLQYDGVTTFKKH